MRELHCPACGTPFVRVTHREGAVESLLNQVNFFSFRCQVCTNEFRALRLGARRATTKAFDRRQFKRLQIKFPVLFVMEQSRPDDLVTDLSMGGCTVQTASTLPRGSFVELHLKPMADQDPIQVETAMVSSVRQDSMGLKFLEFDRDEQYRLSQVVLGLLMSQGAPPSA